MGLKQFERRLERLVEGAFAKAFRSGLQPVEIGRRLIREVDEGRQVGVRGVIAPNQFTVWMGPEDRERFDGLEHALIRELTDYVREHVRQEDYHFVGPLTIELDTDDGMKRGDLFIDAEIDDAGVGVAGSLVLPSGDRVPLADRTMVLGRHDDCDVTLDDPKISRRHAEIRSVTEGFEVADLGSTNGTLVNDSPVSRHLLEDGDQIRLGDTTIRFEAS